MKEMLTESFELGPIRPPSEAYSLLIRVTRNCPWNRCKFCPIYKGEKFQLRSVAEIKQDIRTAKIIQEKRRRFFIVRLMMLIAMWLSGCTPVAQMPSSKMPIP
jgi:radical SAM superfamily enzyme YgiQ (UPF0313 family)